VRKPAATSSEARRATEEGGPLRVRGIESEGIGMSEYLEQLYGLRGKVAALTGGGGVLCGTMAKALGRLGVKCALLDIFEDKAQAVANDVKALGAQAIAVKCDVLDKASCDAAARTVVETLGGCDILINGAGGNKKEATTSPELSFFDLPGAAIDWVFRLNCLGTILPSQSFGRVMAQKGEGCIINISSMSAYHPLTKVPAYSAAKAAISNFTEWLAVHMAQNYSKKIRVNALAPGFFLTEQNRFLLTDDKTGELTARGKTIIAKTPLGRFGEPEELLGALIWLLSPSASFVHGVIIVVDGGFNAFGGV
jgi:NAD(P)-dependent dehydrogenase (short-subunit alcohol dehydrogenase family)